MGRRVLGSSGMAFLAGGVACCHDDNAWSIRVFEETLIIIVIVIGKRVCRAAYQMRDFSKCFASRLIAELEVKPSYCIMRL